MPRFKWATPMAVISTIAIAAVFIGQDAIVIGQGQARRSAVQQEKGGENETSDYQLVENWLKPRPGREDGYVSSSVVSVFAESPDRVFFVQRGELPKPDEVKPGPGAFFGSIGRGRNASTQARNARRGHYVLVADRNGNIVEDWTQWDSLWEGAVGPHHIEINPYDPEKHVWIVDNGLNVVFEFTNDGKQLVKTLGEKGVAGEDERHFKGPAGIAFAPDGSFYVTDGYGNARVVKFDKNGNYLLAWGTRGSAPGQFLPSVHTADVDDAGRVYVTDRGNHRIQVFDGNGKFIEEWPNIRDPWDVHVASDQNVWVVDGTTDRFFKYDRAGHLLYSWGSSGDFPAGINGVHQFSVDQEGNLYNAEAHLGRIQKFSPKPGADPAKIIARERPMPRTVRGGTR